MEPLLVAVFFLIVVIVLVRKSKKKAAEEERQRQMEEARRKAEAEYALLEQRVLKTLGLQGWNVVEYCDERIVVKSRQALDSYDYIKYLKENNDNLAKVERVLTKKNDVAHVAKQFIYSNDYKTERQYGKIQTEVEMLLRRANAYRVKVSYVSSAGNCLGQKELEITQHIIDKVRQDPSLIMGKGEYNKLIKEQQKAEKAKQKEQQKEELNQKHRKYYEVINKVIDYANATKDQLVIKEDKEQFDILIAKLFDRTVNSIKKIKTVDSEEWNMIKSFTSSILNEIKNIVDKNNQIVTYYDSAEFTKIKSTCSALMSTQIEFNEYIDEKANNISQLFGTRVIRNETVNEDEYNYIRPYKKTITPFTAEVSSSVFESAENNPLEYIVKHFYPNKSAYPDQIQKLRLLVQELETLREAKQIIENYKAEYQQYLGDVPAFIMEHDEAGFYSKLGFAHIDESVLTVEYKFAYTSGGGMAHRYFTVPMTEETIIELIKVLESKLTQSAFTKQQRALMTKKLRDAIKIRDNYTCRQCGNSTHKEPNLLLEIDHIVPVAKGGPTEESNLQTLCWKCNRSKGAKL